MSSLTALPHYLTTTSPVQHFLFSVRVINSIGNITFRSGRVFNIDFYQTGSRVNIALRAWLNILVVQSELTPPPPPHPFTEYSYSGGYASGGSSGGGSSSAGTGSYGGYSNTSGAAPPPAASYTQPQYGGGYSAPPPQGYNQSQAPYAAPPTYGAPPPQGECCTSVSS